MRGRNYSTKTKHKAERLRSQGKTYNEIRLILGIPKSTLSLWVSKKYPKIFDRQAQLEHLAKIRLLSAKKLKERTELREKK